MDEHQLKNFADRRKIMMSFILSSPNTILLTRRFNLLLQAIPDQETQCVVIYQILLNIIFTKFLRKVSDQKHQSLYFVSFDSVYQFHSKAIKVRKHLFQQINEMFKSELDENEILCTLCKKLPYEGVDVTYAYYKTKQYDKLIQSILQKSQNYEFKDEEVFQDFQSQVALYRINQNKTFETNKAHFIYVEGQNKIPAEPEQYIEMLLTQSFLHIQKQYSKKIIKYQQFFPSSEINQYTLTEQDCITKDPIYDPIIHQLDENLKFISRLINQVTLVNELVVSENILNRRNQFLQFKNINSILRKIYVLKRIIDYLKRIPDLSIVIYPRLGNFAFLRKNKYYFLNLDHLVQFVSHNTEIYNLQIYINRFLQKLERNIIIRMPIIEEPTINLNQNEQIVTPDQKDVSSYLNQQFIKNPVYSIQCQHYISLIALQYNNFFCPQCKCEINLELLMFDEDYNNAFKKVKGYVCELFDSNDIIEDYSFATLYFRNNSIYFKIDQIVDQELDPICIDYNNKLKKKQKEKLILQPQKQPTQKEITQKFMKKLEEALILDYNESIIE